MDVGIGCRYWMSVLDVGCTLTLTRVHPRWAVYLGHIIGYPVLNRVYDDNNPLGNECQNEIMSGDLN